MGGWGRPLLFSGSRLRAAEALLAAVADYPAADVVRAALLGCCLVRTGYAVATDTGAAGADGRQDVATGRRLLRRTLGAAVDRAELGACFGWFPMRNVVSLAASRRGRPWGRCGEGAARVGGRAI